MSNETRIRVFKPSNAGLESPAYAIPARPGVSDFDTARELPTSWWIIRRHRRAILSAFLLAFGIVTIWTLCQKTIYRANALLEIARENPNILTAQDLFTVDSVSDVYLETQYKILKTDSLAERVINELGLDKVKEFASTESSGLLKLGKDSFKLLHSPSHAAPPINSDTHQKTLTLFQDRLNISPIKRSRLVGISFDSEDPVLAARVVNTLTADYIALNLRVRSEASQKASEWLARQLADVKIKLQESESKLQRYASNNNLLVFEIGSGSNENLLYERLRQLQEELSRAQAERYEKESLYNLVKAGDYASLPGVFQDKLIQDLSLQLAELQQQSGQLETLFGANYPKVKQIRNQIAEVEGTLSRERQRAAERITRDYIAAVNRETLARYNFEKQQGQANLVGKKLTTYNTLKRELETNKNIYDGLLQRLREAAGSSGLASNAMRVVDPAKPPQIPVRPKIFLNLGLGALLGLMLGIAVAFIRERSDRSIRSPEEVERFLSLPPLGSVPAINELNAWGYVLPPFEVRTPLSSEPADPKRTRALRLGSSLRRTDSKSALALGEAFRSLCTSVLFSTGCPAPRSILIASAQPKEGKTTIATNLAIALAERGHRILLIDGDMRRPRVHKLFNVSGDFGLSTYLHGEQHWRSVVLPTGFEQLDVLLCGPLPANPVELLSLERVRKLVEEAKSEYRYLIIDSPPLLSVGDGRILASAVEGVILAVKSGVTPRVLLQRAGSSVRDVGGNIVGVVLNNFDFNDYSYGQYHYYASKA